MHDSVETRTCAAVDHSSSLVYEELSSLSYILLGKIDSCPKKTRPFHLWTIYAFSWGACHLLITNSKRTAPFQAYWPSNCHSVQHASTTCKVHRTLLVHVPEAER